MDKNWDDFFKNEINQEYYKEMWNILEEEAKKYTIFPAKGDVFRCMDLCPANDIKVVILSQDPYHTPGRADGLAFSTRGGKDRIPPSLKNIYKEIISDIGSVKYNEGDLTGWAEQGVFLLNSYMTVRKSQPLSHSKIGWNIFTDHVISYINTINNPIVFMLWGSKAREKKELLNNPNHLILECGHPSPQNRSASMFLGCKHFSKANDFLMAHGIREIEW